MKAVARRAPALRSGTMVNRFVLADIVTVAWKDLQVWLGAAAGLSVSVRAATQRQAQDNISLVTMGLTIVAVGIRGGMQAVGLSPVDSLLRANGWLLVGGFAVLLVLGVVTATRVAMIRFKRSACLFD